MSVPSRKPACSTASAIRSSASRLRRQARGEAALVAEAGGQPLALQHRLQRVVGLGAPAQRLAEGRRADRGDHELLDVDVAVGVRAAVEDVHHRHREQVRVRAADVAEQRQARRTRRRPGPRRARRRGSRWRRAGTCWRCRRGRAAPGRPAAARWRRSRRAPGRSRRARRGRPARRPCRRSGPCRRRAARPPRRRRCEAPTGTAARAMVPSSSATSTSTVGLPRESRISRASDGFDESHAPTLSTARLSTSVPASCCVPRLARQHHGRAEVAGARGRAGCAGAGAAASRARARVVQLRGPSRRASRRAACATRSRTSW